MLVHLNELDFYLKKIDAVWPVRCLTGEAIDCEKVVDYYRQSRIVYKYVHSYSGAMHMAVNSDGVFNAKGFYTSLNEIVEIISPLPAGAVLELGCGKGFNSAYLAKKIPHAHFTGIDVSGEHLAIARKKHPAYTTSPFCTETFKISCFRTVLLIRSLNWNPSVMPEKCGRYYPKFSGC